LTAVKSSGLRVLCGVIVFAVSTAPLRAQSPTDAGATELHWAVHRDDGALVDRLIRQGANVNGANEYGVTPLALACTNRNATIVNALLAAKANPNVAQTNGVTPLMECARTGAAAGVASLLSRGASVEAAHAKSGQTALMWAAAGQHPETVKLLIGRGANVRARSKGGFTPLLFAARSGDAESASLLIDAGAHVNEATPEHGSALVVASAGGHERVARLLLDRGANPNVADRFGITPLHNAMQRGLTSLVGMRFDESYRVQPPNMPELAAALLTAGANPNARIAANDTRGPDGTPFEMRGATPYFLAAVAGDATLLRLLARSGADPTLGVDGGATPLMAAARSACTGSCEFRGANLEIDPAAAAAALEAVSVAIESGAAIDAVNDDGQTAMHMAAFTGADGVVRLLADRGAAVDVQDKRGETPWSMAAGLSTVLRYRGQYGTHESTAALLLKLGAKPITQDELEARAAALAAR
jgi:ankyrin repeat protein